MDNIDKNIFLKIGLSMIHNNTNHIYPKDIIYDKNKLKELNDRYIFNLSEQIKNIEMEIENENNRYDQINIMEIGNENNNLFSSKNKGKIILEKLKYIQILKNNITDNITKLEIILEKIKCYKLIAENKL